MLQDERLGLMARTPRIKIGDQDTVYHIAARVIGTPDWCSLCRLRYTQQVAEPHPQVHIGLLL